MAKDYTKYNVDGLGEKTQQKTIGFKNCSGLC